MRTIRLLVADLPAAGGRYSLPPGPAAHAARVLRVTVGDPLMLFDGAGGEAEARVAAVRGSSVEVELAPRVAVDRESPLALTLVQGISRGERMDLVVQKATELGVCRIVPVLTERSVVKLDGAQAAKRLLHWQGIAAAACEQSGRTRLPAIDPVSTLSACLGRPGVAGERRFLLHPGSGARLRDFPSLTSATLLIGPEGGLSPVERDNALSAGFIGLSLGPRILRTETAALAALAALQALDGDL